MQFSLEIFAVQFAPFLIAVVFHEFAHGWMAMKWGDETAKEAGRLTLNPVPHVDLLGSIVFPALLMISGAGFLFGWAKPVPIDPRRFRKYRPGLFLVSFAGPAMNFILAILSAFAFVALLKWGSPEQFFFQPFVSMALVSVFLNLALGIFNLIPLPPLDGSKMVQSFLSIKATIRYESLARYSFFIIIGLLIFGFGKYLMVPIKWASSLFLGFSAWVFGVDSIAIQQIFEQIGG